MASTMTLPSLGVSRRSSVEGKVDRLTPNVPMLILLAHLFDGDGEGICAALCGNREAMWPRLWPGSLRPLLAVPPSGTAWLDG